MIVDATGFEHAPRPVRRVVSLVPSETEALFDLGAGDLVVGRTDWCVEPAGRVENIPSIGGTKTPRVDAIVALCPDLVLANREENVRRHVEALRAAGVVVHVSYPRTALDAARLLRDLGSLLGLGREADDAARTVEAAVADAARRAPSPRPRVFVAIWWDPVMGASPDTYVAGVVEAAGGRMAIEAHEPRYPKMRLEEVAALEPDVVLLPDEPYRFTEVERAHFLELPMPAARRKAVHLLDGKRLAWYGVRTASDVSSIADLLRT